VVVDLRVKYQQELNDVVAQMEQISRNIQELDKQGTELVAKANVLAGKIEVLDELNVAQTVEVEG
jgi:prefoldin subunit 5